MVYCLLLAFGTLSVAGYADSSRAYNQHTVYISPSNPRLPPDPHLGSTLGESFGKGFSDGITRGLNEQAEKERREHAHKLELERMEYEFMLKKKLIDLQKNGKQ